MYIAGGMAAYLNFNFEMFFFVARLLRNGGYIPVNPAAMDMDSIEAGESFTPEAVGKRVGSILIKDLQVINEKCKAVVFVEGPSKGLRVEQAFADLLRLPVYELKGVANGNLR